MANKTTISDSEFNTYLTDSCNPETKDRVEKWIAEKGLSETMTPSLRSVWNNIPYGTSTPEATTAFKQFKKRISTDRTTPLHRVIEWSTRIVAILFVPLLIVTLLNLSDRNKQIVWVEKFVAHGTTEDIVLPDGSKAKLNAGTHIIYPDNFGKNSRHIFLTGEALLNVVKDAKRPFTVSVGTLDVRVLGTQFNVKSYVDESKVHISLLDGSVSIYNQTTKDSPLATLQPGDMVAYNKITKVVTLDKFSTKEYKSWWDGCLFFRNETLKEITAQLSRVFDVEIMLRDQQLKHKRYYVAFMNGETLDQMLEALNTDGRMKIERKGSIVDISHNSL